MGFPPGCSNSLSSNFICRSSQNPGRVVSKVRDATQWAVTTGERPRTPHAAAALAPAALLSEARGAVVRWLERVCFPGTTA